LEIKGFLESSLLEWDGLISAVVFVPTCNLRCPFCYVPDLVLRPEALPSYDPGWLLERLAGLLGGLDGCVISGGSPTLHSWLPRLLGKVRALGLRTKIATNGTHPEVIRSLIERRLVDAVAMDVKSGLFPERYAAACGTTVSVDSILESISLIKGGAVEGEFRTTVVPGIVGPEDVPSIAGALGEGALWYLQQYKPEPTLDPAYGSLSPYAPSVLEGMADAARGMGLDCRVRGI